MGREREGNCVSRFPTCRNRSEFLWQCRCRKCPETLDNVANLQRTLEKSACREDLQCGEEYFTQCGSHFVDVMRRFTKSPSLLLPVQSPIDPPSNRRSLRTTRAGALPGPTYTSTCCASTTMRRATHAVGAIEGSTRFSNSSGNSRRSRGQSKSGSAMYWTACWCRVGTVDRKLKGRSRLRNLRSESVGSVRRP